VLRRVIGPIVGLVFLGVVVYLGVRSASDTKFVPWFGLAAAVLAPSGVALIFEAGRSREARTLEDLRSVPEIDALVARAGTAQERLKLLERERQKLDEIVRIEARRQTSRHAEKSPVRTRGES
jgi:hypothetical protein